MSKNAICVMDFTYNVKEFSDIERIDMSNWLKDFCKSWSFQFEAGETTGNLHYQGRFSLKIKKRCQEVGAPFKWHLSPTSDENKTNNFYVTKDDSRIEGPWKDSDEEIYIPRQFRDIELYTWQKEVLERSIKFNDRIVNCIIDEKGNRGKSTLAAIAELLHGGLDLPPVNDAKELISTICDECYYANWRNPSPIFIDMPRSQCKDRLYGIYAAIEQIKKGKLYDIRYKYRKFWIDSPAVWVFTNKVPELDYLSRDRWRFFTIKVDIHGEKVLTPYKI